MSSDKRLRNMIRDGTMHTYEMETVECVSIMTAVGTYAVRPKFFASKLVWEELLKLSKVRSVDDNWISGNLARANVSMYVLPGRLPISNCTRSYCTPQDFNRGIIIQPWRFSEAQRRTPALGGGNMDMADFVHEYFEPYWTCNGLKSSVFKCWDGKRLHPDAVCKSADEFQT